jgi:hypothetical protein
MLCTFLTTRQQYQTCQVLLPGDEKPMGAIYLNDRLYGFYRQIAKAGQLLKFMLKMRARLKAAAEVMVTQTPKGYFLWLWEPDVSIVGKTPSQPQDTPPAHFYLLEAAKTGFCQIRVPDLEQELIAVAIGEQYYSLFKLEADTVAVMEIIAKLTRRGDELAIALTRGGYAICVLEPDARLMQRRA